MSDFDPVAILQTPLSEYGVKGERPPKELLPEGDYGNCTILEVDPLEPSEEQADKGIQVVLVLRLKSPEHPESISTTVKIYDMANPSGKSKHFKVIQALYPDEAVRAKKTAADWVGDQLHVSIYHDSFVAQGGKTITYEDWKFRAIKGKK